MMPTIGQPDLAAVEKHAALLFRAGDFGEALETCRRGLAIDGTARPLLHIAACALLRSNRLQEAQDVFERLLAIDPDHVPGLMMRGVLLGRTGQSTAAFALFERALALEPNRTDVRLHKGSLLATTGRFDEALACFDGAIAIDATAADAWLGRGNALIELKRPGEALDAYDRALTLRPDFADAWLGRGHALGEARRTDEATVAYDRALALRPDFVNAWLGRGNLLLSCNDLASAGAAFDKALALQPGLAEAWLGHGNLLVKLRRPRDAHAAYQRALALKPALAETWFGLGKLLYLNGQYDEAAAAFGRAQALRPDPQTLGLLLRARTHLCDWSDFEAASTAVIAAVEAGRAAEPFSFVALSSTPAQQRRSAELWVAANCPPAAMSAWTGEPYAHDRIRIGYVSSDFHGHAVMYHVASLFERHDRSRFEVFGLSIGPEDDSDMRRRLVAAFDRFFEVHLQSDDEVAALVRSLEIDILVDLTGYTGGGRTEVFARRPAPLQVHYIGFPGTMGAPYYDYVVADRIVIPDDERGAYTENIVVMPDSYQVNDVDLEASDRTFSRAELGLPQNGVVFCCFNNTYKITPAVFDVWMRILAAVPGSVLWLYESNATAGRNLRNEATARGIDPGRLVFAPMMPLPDHLARHRLADLFLDTLPYNAHATGSLALRAGVPVLTCRGGAFPGRVGASLLTAIGLPELITTTLADYEALAVALARDPDRLAAVTEKLHRQRTTTPLFDAARFTRHLEAAYAAMLARHRAGMPPDHIDLAEANTTLDAHAACPLATRGPDVHAATEPHHQQLTGSSRTTR